MRHLPLLAALLAGCPGKDDSATDPTDDTGTPLVDADGDGVPLPADCDDTDPYTYPGATELPYDGEDQDCDGADLVDADGDGSVGELAGGDDCMDSNPEVHPGATEICYDGLDNDCSGDPDTDDCDGDGADRFVDCNDEDATVYPGAPDTWYDGVDSNCDFQSDYDQDGDGFDAAGHGYGDDCDDLDPTVHTDAEERWNGRDDNCDGLTDQLNTRQTAGSVYGEGDSADSWFGYDFAPVRDLDGDGWRELVAGVPLSGKQAGKVYVVPRLDGATDIATEALATIDGDGTEALGLAVVALEDADGGGWVGVGGIEDGYLYALEQLTGGAALGPGDAVATFQLGTDAGELHAWDGDAPGLFACSEFYLGYSTECALFDLAGASGTMDVGAARFSVTGSGIAMGTGDVGDLDGDGMDELVLGGNAFSDTTTVVIVTSDVVTAGGAVGTDAFSTFSGASGTIRAHGEDFDGDGANDLILSEYTATGEAGELAGVIHLLASDAALAGGVVTSSSYGRIEGPAESVAIRAAESTADIDGDGAADLLVAGPGEASGDVYGEVWWIARDTVAAGGTILPARATPAFLGTGADDQFGWLVVPDDADSDGDVDLFVSLLGGTGGALLYVRE